MSLVFMRLRKVPPPLIANSLILATKAGILDINTQVLETHYLAGGNLTNLIKFLIVADKANLNLTLNRPLPLTWLVEMYWKLFRFL